MLGDEWNEETAPATTNACGHADNEGPTMSMDQSKPAEEPAVLPSGQAPAGGEQQSPPPKRKRRWLRVLLWVLAVGLSCLVLLIAMLPTIISSGTVTRRIAADASARLNRDVRIGDLSVGWRSGVQVTDVAVLERDGSPFASLKSLSCDLGILPLLGGRLLVRDLSIVEPKVVIRRDKEGRLNIDDLRALGKATPPEKEPDEPKEEGSDTLPDASIRATVANGTFEFHDEATGETVSIHDFEAALAMPSVNDPISLSVDFHLTQGGKTEAVSLKAEALIAEQNRLLTDRATASLDLASVPVQASMRLDMGQFNGAPDAKGAQLMLHCDLGQLMVRIGPIVGLPEGMQVAGTIKSEMAAAGDLGSSIGVKGTTVISGLSVTGGPLADMPVRQDTVRSSVDLVLALRNQQPESAVLNALSVEAPALTVEASGKASDLGGRGDVQATVNADADLPEIVGLVSGLLPPELKLAGHARMTMTASTSLDALANATGGPFASLGAVAAEGSAEVDRVEYASADTQLTLADLRLQPIKLAGSVLTAAGQFKANDGPGTLQTSIDFTGSEPAFNTTIEARNIALTQRVSLLGYVIPLLILPADGKIQSSASFTATAQGTGLAWETLREKLKASGSLELGDGTISGGEILGAILKLTGQRDQFQFDGMSTTFGLADGKITSDAIQVNSRALSFALQGWTSIIPDPETGGYAMEYRPGAEILRKYAGKDYERIMALLGKQGEGYSPLVIGGLVQKPRVKLELPGLGDAAKGLLGGALGDVLGGKGDKKSGGDAKKEGAADLLRGLLK